MSAEWWDQSRTAEEAARRSLHVRPRHAGRVLNRWHQHTLAGFRLRWYAHGRPMICRVALSPHRDLWWLGPVCFSLWQFQPSGKWKQVRR